MGWKCNLPVQRVKVFSQEKVNALQQTAGRSLYPKSVVCSVPMLVTCPFPPSTDSVPTFTMCVQLSCIESTFKASLNVLL